MLVAHRGSGPGRSWVGIVSVGLDPLAQNRWWTVTSPDVIAF
jgi:hypothetical protein